MKAILEISTGDTVTFNVPETKPGTATDKNIKEFIRNSYEDQTIAACVGEACAALIALSLFSKYTTEEEALAKFQTLTYTLTITDEQ